MGTNGRKNMNSSRGTVYHPSLNPASMSGKAFLITAEDGVVQRSVLPPGWFVVRVNPASVQAMQRAVARPYSPDEESTGRELPY
jgi:hypothetical protein